MKIKAGDKLLCIKKDDMHFTYKKIYTVHSHKRPQTWSKFFIRCDVDEKGFPDKPNHASHPLPSISEHFDAYFVLLSSKLNKLTNTL